MSHPTDERQQIQLELEGLKRTLEWTEIQKEQFLDHLDLLRRDNARLQDRVEELERQVDGRGMDADDLPCSRNARSKTPLVGRAQEEINQPPSLRENERAWKDYLYGLSVSQHDRTEFASIHAMKYLVVNIEDVRWLLGHTGGFRGGYVTDVHVSKRRLLDEASGREVPAGTTVTLVIRYRIRQMVCVAKLTMTGVTDFSMFEQEGADCSALGVIQAELTDGKLRFWFDPQGELYVVCEEAQLEEVAAPSLEPLSLVQVAQWTFQSDTADWPTVTWILAELDVAGVPCTWRAVASSSGRHPSIQWEGDLLPASMQGTVGATGVRCMLYGSLDGPGFGVVLRVRGVQDRRTGQVLSLLADLIAQRFSGRCLVGNTIIPGGEWQNWKSFGQQREADG